MSQRDGTPAEPNEPVPPYQFRDQHPEPDMTIDPHDAAILGYLMGERADAPLSEQGALDDLRDLLADPTLWEAPPAHLADSVVAAVAVAASTASAAPKPEPAPGNAPEAVVIPLHRRVRARLSPVLTTAVTVAASVALGTVVGVNLTDDSAAPTGVLTNTLAQAGVVPAAGLPSVALSPQEKEKLSQADLRELEGGPFAGPALGRFPGVLFWISNAANGSARLSREVAQLYDHAGRANGALRGLLNRKPADPDERSPWPSGATGDVDLSSVHGGTGAIWPAGTAVVYLNSAALSARASSAEARAAVQQIVWTLRANDPTITAVVISAAEAKDRAALAAQGLWGSGEKVDSAVRAGEPSAVLAPVQLDSPTEGALLDPRQFTVSGAAITANGRVRWEVRDRGQVIQRGEASTGACCSLSGYSFPLTLPPGRWTIVVYPGPTGTDGAATRTIEVDSIKT